MTAPSILPLPQLFWIGMRMGLDMRQQAIAAVQVGVAAEQTCRVCACEGRGCAKRWCRRGCCRLSRLLLLVWQPASHSHNCKAPPPLFPPLFLPLQAKVLRLNSVAVSDVTTGKVRGEVGVGTVLLPLFLLPPGRRRCEGKPARLHPIPWAHCKPPIPGSPCCTPPAGPAPALTSPDPHCAVMHCCRLSTWCRMTCGALTTP